MLDRLREPWSDQRAERTLGALASVVLLLIVLMIVFVAARAWPSFQHNGLSWFTGKGDVDVQIGNQVNTGAKSGEYGGVRNFWMVTRGHPRAASPLQKFIYWVQNSPKAAKIVQTHWVPLK